MRMCIDLTALADNFSGIERFALSMTRELIKSKEHHWILLFKNSIYEEFNKELDNVEKIVIKGKNKLAFNQVILPLTIAGIKADRFFFPAFPAPFFTFKRGVTNTIHDLSCWDCPESNKKYMIWYFRIMYWKASLCNKKIVTVSEFSKGRICSILKVKENSVAVVYNGISDGFNMNKLTEVEKTYVREKYSLPERYSMCLSTLEPRKNLRLLLDAYSMMFEQGYVEEIVLAGRKGWKMENFLKGYTDEFLQHVHFTGFVDEEDLPAIYKMAKVFVFPSMYEGFGIPPLEALACGTPVISSDAASLPEVLKDTAYFFENKNVDDLISVIKKFDGEEQGEEDRLRSSNMALKYKWTSEAKKILKYLEE